MEKISIKINVICVFIFNCMCDDALGKDDACKCKPHEKQKRNKISCFNPHKIMPHLIMCNGERENILRRQKVPLKAYLEL